MTFKTRIIGIISVWFLCACYLQHTPGLEQVIAKVTDQKVKSALLQFEEGGIEKSINSKENLSADNLITSAKYFLNTPHCMGGTTKKCIECSGLLWAVFNQNGAVIPHSSLDQARFGKVISEIESLQEGDLVFFYGTYDTPKLITHSGIYLGDGTFIHTSSRQDRVW